MPETVTPPAQQKYYSIGQVAALLRMGYSEARDKLLKSGRMVQSETGKFRVPEDLVEEIAKRQRRVPTKLEGLTLSREKASIYDIPQCPDSTKFVSLRDLGLHLPFYENTLESFNKPEQLKKAVVLGRYRNRRFGNVVRYYLPDFHLPDDWMSPVERCFKELTSLLIKVRSADPENEAAKAGFDLAVKWYEALKEDRLAIERATGRLTEHDHRANYEHVKKQIYDNVHAWESAEIRAMISNDFEILL